jgi:phospholipid-translocating ATPase
VTYIAPLAFVLLVTMGKEAYDDYKRNLRDREANSARYLILAPHPAPTTTSCRTLCSKAACHRRAPSRRPRSASVTSSYSRRISGCPPILSSSARPTLQERFIRTDQLDGETDWKLRVAVPATQKLPSDQELLNLYAEIYGVSARVIAPACSLCSHSYSCSGCAHQRHSRVHWYIHDQYATRWVFQRGAYGPGADCRATLSGERAMGEHGASRRLCYRLCGLHRARDTNTSHPQTKIGLLDLEISQLAKVCRSRPSFEPAYADAVNEDSVCCFFRTVRCARCTERVSWTDISTCSGS